MAFSITRPLALVLVGLFTAAGGCGESPSSSDSKSRAVAPTLASEKQALEAPAPLSSIRFRAKWITPNSGDCGSVTESVGTHNWGMGVLIGGERPIGESSIGPTANFACGLGEQPPTPFCGSARTISYPDPVTDDCPHPDAPDECAPPVCVGSGATQDEDWMRTAAISGDTTIRVDLRGGTLDNVEDIFFELDIDAETRTATPGNRHPRVDTLTSECVTWVNGAINWEFCFEVDFCATSDATCDGVDDDCDGEVDDDYVSIPSSCGDGGACRAMGATICHAGGIEIDHCTPAPVIDFSGASCPDIPASTFTTQGMNDTDSDGIPDLWETNGFDANCDGDVTDAVDLPFQVWGANPLHKDLFVEFDWMTGEEPRRGNIQAMKDAFANAPVDAGGASNPDGLPGINLFMDTGALVDATGSLVGDNLGGGNAMAVQYFSRPDARFKAAKCENFNPIRERFFRYGISARRGCLNPLATEDGGGPGSCQNVMMGIAIDDSDDGQDAYDTDCQAGGSGFEDGSSDPNSCTDSRNNGADGLANCGDPDCHYDPGADEGLGPNTCSNGSDDDGDNKIDSADSDNCHYALGYSGADGLLDHTHFGITIMHELGHMLGLGHGGPYRINGMEFVGDKQDRKPNHLSIMHNGNWPGIRLRTSEDGSLVANSCFDEIDNGGDGVQDIFDPNCQVGHDVWGPDGLPDGIPDGVILDYSPPRRTDGSRVQLPNLDEAMLSEALALDPLDSRNLFAYVGYDPTRLEDGINTCGDGDENGGGDGADNTDSDCFIGTVFVPELPEDNVSTCNDGIDNGDGDGADQADRTSDCRKVFINAVDGDNDGVGGPDALAIDWQRDGVLDLDVPVDINGFWDLADFWDPEENLLGADDWRNLKIRPPGLGGAQIFQVLDEPTIQEVEAQLRHERGTDLGISFDALPTGIGLGQPVSVRVVVTNLGPRRAAEYTAVLRLPPGVTLDDPNCSQVGSRVECPRSNLGVRAADVFTVVIRIGPNPVSAVRTLAAEVEVVDAENLNAANNLFGRLLVEPSAGCDPQAPFEAAVAAFTGSMNADGLTFSADGLTAYISGPGTQGNDIFKATRSPNGTFGTPTRVDFVSSIGQESAPSLSPDGLALYLTSDNSSSGVGWTDIARSVWQPSTSTWSAEHSLGSPFNSSVNDQDPFWWGSNKIYFVSERPDGAHRDIYESTWSGTTFSQPERVPGVDLHSTFEEFRPVVSPDGLTLYYGSRRYGVGNDTSGDVFMARRTPSNSQFQQSVNLWSMNNTGIDFPVTVSADGCTLYFASNEETGLGGSTNYRLYQAKRGASTPAQVMVRLNILGTGSVTQGPFNCTTGNVGTCSASAPPDTTWLVNANTQAQWTGTCSGNGGQPSTDGVIVFSQNAVCTIKFPNAPLVGFGALCSLTMDCQQGLRCVNNACG
jgi:hypothetical protein